MHGASDTFDTALKTALERWNLPIELSQLNRLRAHFEAVVETNRVMNLTRITDPVEAAVKHYADSLALLTWVRKCGITVRTVLDVGTGAGFPAFPLAAMQPDWSVTAIDATGKKIEFLRRTAAAIGVGNLHCEHAHSQHWRPGCTFDVVVCRAVAPLPKILEQTAKHVSQGSRLVAYKTAPLDVNEQNAANALALKLQFHKHEQYEYDLESDHARLDRVLCVYRRKSTARCLVSQSPRLSVRCHDQVQRSDAEHTPADHSHTVGSGKPPGDPAWDVTPDWTSPDTSGISEVEFPIDCEACGYELTGLGDVGCCPRCGAAFHRAQRLLDLHGPEAFLPEAPAPRKPTEQVRGVGVAILLTGLAVLAAVFFPSLSAAGLVTPDRWPFVVLLFLAAVAAWIRAIREGPP